MPRWFLIDSGKSMPRWCELVHDPEGTGNSHWVDFKFRKIPFEDGRPLAHVDGDHIASTMLGVSEVVADIEISAAERWLLKPESGQGWIAPDGRFFGCGYYEHDDIAYALIRMDPRALENEGWVRVHESSFIHKSSARRITGRQVQTLLELGFVDPGNGDFATRVSPEYSKPKRAVLPKRQAQDLALAGKNDASTKETVRARTSKELFLERLRGNGLLAIALNVQHEVVDDVGPGDWT